jgi:hypothetical protein
MKMPGFDHPGFIIEYFMRAASYEMVPGGPDLHRPEEKINVQPQRPNG